MPHYFYVASTQSRCILKQGKAREVDALGTKEVGISGRRFHSEPATVCVPAKSVSSVRPSLEGKLEHLPAGGHLRGQFLSLCHFVLTATLEVGVRAAQGHSGRPLEPKEGLSSPRVTKSPEK